MSDDWQTRQTLLQRAKNQDDHQAWKEFVDYYRSFIEMIIRKMNLVESERQDLVQEILLKLWQNLAVYSADKASFRTWLSTIIRNAVVTFYKANGRRRQREEESSFLEAIENGSEPELEKLIEVEWINYITNYKSWSSV